MKRVFLFSGFLILSSLFFCCLEMEDHDFYSFEGTWLSNDQDAIYKGSLVITKKTITISEYGENQTPANGDDNKRPFKNFTKNIPLEYYSETYSTDYNNGYTEKGAIFIKDGGEYPEEGLSYVFWFTSSSGTENKFLRFTFSERVETLKLDSEPEL